MTPEEIERIRNKEGEELEQFEMVGKGINSIKLRDTEVDFKNDYRELEKLNINIQDFDNPNHLVDYGALFRYLNVVNAEAVSACESEIKEHLEVDLPKLMTITDFHYRYPYVSIDDEEFSQKKRSNIKGTKL